MSSEAQAPTPSPTSVIFARGVIARLKIWPALRVAVQESWGGPNTLAKRTWLASVVVDAFEDADSDNVPDDQYVEEMLLQMMADEFDAVLEDGSAEVVARDIVALWEESKVGGGAVGRLVTKFEEMADKIKGKKEAVQVVASEEEDGDDDDDDDEEDGNWEDEDGDVPMGDEAPQLIDRSSSSQAKQEPEVDEDGFTLVKKKGRR